MEPISSSALDQFLEVITQQVIAKSAEKLDAPELLTEQQAAQRFNVSPRKLQAWRFNERLIKGVHWTQVEGSIRYIPEMLRDRFINWDDDTTHLATIEEWRRQQTKARSKRKGKVA
ncbi:MAG: hypothetical protein AAGA75_21770 [Cyanobacteria bacterium P01_E01_bin.6]